MDRGAWWAAVHGVTKSRTRLSNFTFHFSLSCIGEGNGNPLQCSCLENPRDSGAWWAAIYGVAQSQTRLKRLSSSNKHFTCFTTFHLYVEIHFYTTDWLEPYHWPLVPGGLMVGFSDLTDIAWLQSLARNGSPASSYCRQRLSKSSSFFRVGGIWYSISELFLSCYITIHQSALTLWNTL